jgi:hypothetical protein
MDRSSAKDAVKRKLTISVNYEPALDVARESQGYQFL